MLGVVDQCPKCSKAAYAAERVMGPGRKYYHKSCLMCTLCGSRLAPGALQEHDEQPYCRNCYLKLFSTLDLRHQNLHSRDCASPSSSPNRSTPSAVTPQYTSSTPNVAQVVPLGQTNTVGARFNVSSQTQCPLCGSAVYHAEQVVALGKKWHRACLQCSSCQRRLESHNICDNDGDAYCRMCYSQKHGPTGCGYALVGKPGG
ncbi:uncharacterized protein EI90DRAFT_2909855 [Cantharellus anzutake]|uniref:uncharacterized protein n=1 Tax=Cantharellus anzutake TaxID=1750568 RepID=UPI0019045079|nr:uncharacterized protein EI90DRAFT_2909855 [Cantharellus anzutake]KAF8337651.1 hypothetical protein EI90DRAFT_2909855 [Cantharellus anzutake]